MAHAAANDGVAGLIARIREHKIMQWALAYIGAAITIAHGEELLAHAFAWNEGIARWLVALLVVGFRWSSRWRGIRAIRALRA